MTALVSIITWDTAWLLAIRGALYHITVRKIVAALIEFDHAAISRMHENKNDFTWLYLDFPAGPPHARRLHAGPLSPEFRVRSGHLDAYM